MEFTDVVRKRRMRRNFDDREVDEDVLRRIMETAIRAPSAGFSQGWGFLVLTHQDDRARFWDIEWPADQRQGPVAEGLLRAPVLIVPMSNKEVYLDRYAEPDKGWADRDESRWPVPFWDIDTGFAAMLILLAAVDEGLGALFFGLRNAAEFRGTFGVPPAYNPIGAIALGHPAPDTPSPSLKRGRRSIDDVVHLGRWRESR